MAFDAKGSKQISVLNGRKLSLGSAKPVGSGYTADVYDLDDGNVVKVLKKGDASEAEREILLSKWAFSKGIPTAISYDVVDVDGRPGLVYESLGRGNLRNLFRDHPEQFDSAVAQYVDLLHTINSITDDENKLPDAAALMRGCLPTLRPILSDAEYEKMSSLLASIPDRRTIVHGDCQVKNVRVVKGELYLIDLDTLSHGDPIFELAQLYFCYRCFNDIRNEEIDSFFDISTDILHRVLDAVLDGYMAGVSDTDKRENKAKIALLAYMHMMYFISTETPDDAYAAEVTMARFKSLLSQVDDLRLVL